MERLTLPYYRKIGEQYYDSQGKIVKSPAIVERLSKIRVPKTYKDIRLYRDNKIIATGIDGKGSLQYFYSDEHKRKSSREKNCNLISFGEVVPEILKDIENILLYSTNIDNIALHALALRLMILCHFRVGSQRNLKKNGTYGLVTIGPDHLDISQRHIQISFNGKKNQLNTCLVQDLLTVNLLKELTEYHDKRAQNTTTIPKLLEYQGITVTPTSLNQFLKGYHPSITTKTWRTWFANLAYIEKLSQQIPPVPKTKKDRKQMSNSIIKGIAEELHHTPAINKRNYLIPELVELFVSTPDLWVKTLRGSKNSTDFLLNFLHKDYCMMTN